MAIRIMSLLFSAYTVPLIFWPSVQCQYTGKQVLKHMSQAIGESVLECQNEVGFPNDIITDFLNYWRQNYRLRNGELGCVVHCVMLKLEVAEPNGTLRVDNFEAFTHANGADDMQTGYLTALCNRCNFNLSYEEPCVDGMTMANCFRAGVINLNYVPDPGDDPDDDF